MSVKAMTIEDLYIGAKIEDMQDFLIYVCVDGVNIPMRLCEWDVENHCVILHEKFNPVIKYCTECKHCIGEPTILVSEDTGLWAMAYSCLGGNPKKKGMFTCKEKACEYWEGKI